MVVTVGKGTYEGKFNYVSVLYSPCGRSNAFVASIIAGGGGCIPFIQSMWFKVFMLAGFLCIRNFVPRGANGVALKLTFPKIAAYANKGL